ncbi:hypothetical protein BDD12DRAFT_841910 [Trichophaea hybrida]|nr:hypothetical protein BDD12DRAFT_841910 [Trichophaea hybrida]
MPQTCPRKGMPSTEHQAFGRVIILHASHPCPWWRGSGHSNSGHNACAPNRQESRSSDPVLGCDLKLMCL